MQIKVNFRVARRSIDNKTGLAAGPMRLQVHEIGNQCSPACLVTGSAAAPGISVKVFAKQKQTLPVRVFSVAALAAIARAVTGSVRQKKPLQTTREIARGLAKSHPLSRTRGEFNAQALPIEQMIDTQRFEDEVVDGEPYRSAPIGVAAERTARTFPRLVVHRIGVTASGV